MHFKSSLVLLLSLVCACSPPPLANGKACSSDSECKDGFCTDGVCCESRCDGACSACSAEKTGGAAGVCAPVKAGTDPDSECSDDACGSGFCGGAGMCAPKAAGASCRAAAGSCDVAEECDGVGH